MYMASIRSIYSGLWLSGDGDRGAEYSDNYLDRMAFYDEDDAEMMLEKLNDTCDDCYVLLDESC